MGRTQVPGTQVKDSTINTVDLVDKAVTLQKMADVASGSVFYRKTSGIGSPEVQDLNTLRNDLYAELLLTAKQTAQITNSSNTTPTDITGLYFDLVSGRRYVFKFFVTFKSAATGTGVGFVFSAPAMTAANWKVSITQGNAGTDQTFENSATSLTTVLVSASVAAANTDYMAIIEGFCEPSANGNLQLRCRSEVNGPQITIKNSGVGYLIDAG
jgi:hypothetical protein